MGEQSIYRLDRDYLTMTIKREDYCKNFTRVVGKYVNSLSTKKSEQITNRTYKFYLEQMLIITILVKDYNEMYD